MSELTIIIKPSNLSRRAQHNVKRLIEYPVMHILYAYQKLGCRDGFYPTIDVEELYDILTLSEQDLLIRINPNLGGNKKQGGIMTPRPSVAYDNSGDRYQQRKRDKRWKFHKKKFKINIK